KKLYRSLVPFTFVTKWLPMEARRDVFQAIADPTRREIINLISQRPMNLNAVAENFDISRPAISKHIRILTECGLVSIDKQGRERYCRANLQPLSEVSQWVEKYRTFWNDRLDALSDLLQQENLESRHKKKR